MRNLRRASEAPGDAQARREREDQVVELEAGAAVLEALRACGQPLLYGIEDRTDSD